MWKKGVSYSEGSRRRNHIERKGPRKQKELRRVKRRKGRKKKSRSGRQRKRKAMINPAKGSSNQERSGKERGGSDCNFGKLTHHPWGTKKEKEKIKQKSEFE